MADQTSYQILPAFRTGKPTRAPLACEGCKTQTSDLDQNHRRQWLCPPCFMGAHHTGLDAFAASLPHDTF